MKTYQPKEKEVKRNWHLMDAKGEVLGRFATKVAKILIGKNKAEYSAHMDNGDYVVVVNSEKIRVTGKKEFQKKYYRHSGYPGGLKEVSYSKMMETFPERIIIHAVSGMLPGNKLKKLRLARLKIFVGEKHPYEDKLKREVKS